MDPCLTSSPEPHMLPWSRCPRAKLLTTRLSVSDEPVAVCTHAGGGVYACPHLCLCVVCTHEGECMDVCTRGHMNTYKLCVLVACGAHVFV